jgi:Kef-type K+ transport system membrane component KefB
MDTAPSILEIGLLLLAAVAFGWTARRLGLPAVVGYLALEPGLTGTVVAMSGRGS